MNKRNRWYHDRTMWWIFSIAMIVSFALGYCDGKKSCPKWEWIFASPEPTPTPADYPCDEPCPTAPREF